MIVLWPEIRDVKDPATPVHAFTENGRTVIEVDEKLQGRERSRLILAAWREHESGLAALVAIVVLVYAWDPFKQWASRHPGSAVAVGVGYGGALALTVTSFLATLVDIDPHMHEPHSITVTAPPRIPDSATPTAQTPERTQVGTPTREPRMSTTGPGDHPAPIARPTRDTPRSEPTRLPTTKQPAHTSAPASPDRKPSPQATKPSVAANTTDGPEPETTTRHVSASASSRPEPTPETPPSRDCLLRVEVDPLLDVCAVG